MKRLFDITMLVFLLDGSGCNFCAACRILNNSNRYGREGFFCSLDV